MRRFFLKSSLALLALTSGWSEVEAQVPQFDGANNSEAIIGSEVPATEVPGTQLEATPSTAPVSPAPPTAQAFVVCAPKVEKLQGQTMVPITFFSSGMGASVGPVDQDLWRILYFGRQLDLTANSAEATIDGAAVTLPVSTKTIGKHLYVPMEPIANWMGINWSIAAPTSSSPAYTTTILLQYPAAYITDVRSSITNDRVRVVFTLSNPTRIVAGQEKLNVNFQLAAARVAGIPSVNTVNDYLVSRTVLTSGNWQANVGVRLNYAAPIQWFTLDGPPRLVIDVQRIFEEQSQNPMEGGLNVTKIRKGTGHGPVQMWAVKLDPKDGWRVRVVPGGWGVLQKAQPSQLAARHNAPLAINGGFFAYKGAAVGAVLVNGEWIRLPWKGRTAMGFKPDGSVRIDNLQVDAYVQLGNGLKLPIRNLNGWPGKNVITAITRRFVPYYTLRPGEMAVVVKDGKVLSKPGGGGVPVSAFGFSLVASGGARQWLDKVTRGQTAKLVIKPKGWEGITTALGGGPRLLKNGTIDVADARENFRADVRNGAAPRTAFGVDRDGRYIILVADGRQKFYSTGLTLTETAAVMQQLGAVDAMNLDGGGSTAMAVRGKVVNRPSDGKERSVANALLVMR